MGLIIWLEIFCSNELSKKGTGETAPIPPVLSPVSPSPIRFADYAEFTSENITEGEAFLEKSKPPYVLKADGLAAGKGVLILDDLMQAKKELRQMLLQKKFGKASRKVVLNMPNNKPRFQNWSKAFEYSDLYIQLVHIS